LFVGIDDFSRELYAAILPDKTPKSAGIFLKQVIEECPYTIECAYSDNGTEYKETLDHTFVACCKTNRVAQKFTRVRHPQTSGKAEHVIKTILQMRMSKQSLSHGMMVNSAWLDSLTSIIRWNPIPELVT
jgi:transposase InsO family protein